MGATGAEMVNDYSSGGGDGVTDYDAFYDKSC